MSPRASPEEFGLPARDSHPEHAASGAEWVYLLCAQSLFKLHPRFDMLIAAVLARSPHALVVFTEVPRSGVGGAGDVPVAAWEPSCQSKARRSWSSFTLHPSFTEGRRPLWTAVFKARLMAALGGPASPLWARVRFLPRQAAGATWMQLLSLADVMLHPFPFGGSRTSADGLALGVPIVTAPTAMLRGRMARSFLVTMGPRAAAACVATSATHYVELASALAR